METISQSAGALISLILGFIAIFWPEKTETFTSVQGIGKEGNSEIRATYGGFFFGIALFALLSQNTTVFLVLGIGWLSAALVRLASFCFGFYTNKNLMGVVFEGLIGLLCLSSFIF
ncbi:MAG: hypothetical protein P8J61_03380 [Gammaproteobacteria bacterium]|nr:hypothetical protein [Gammaproteobacteria bacterium]